MATETKERWRELAEQLATETDPEKSIVISKELRMELQKVDAEPQHNASAKVVSDFAIRM